MFLLPSRLFRARLTVTTAGALCLAALAGALLKPAVLLANSNQLPVEQTGGLAGPRATATAAARSATSTPATTSAATPAATPAATSAVTPTVPPTEALSLELLLPTATPQPTTQPTAIVLTLPEVTTPEPTIEAPAVPLEGTILVNRTEARVRFFVEGATHELPPLRSLGLQLERPTAVLNLYNCDAALGETQSGCFWDPYQLQGDGFYEIVHGADVGALVGLVLREALAPPAGQVLIHNRSGVAEQVYFGTRMHELPAGAVAEFAVAGADAGAFYLRTCVSMVDQPAAAPVCEWTANAAVPGAYYALVVEEWAGSIPGAVVQSLTLQPLAIGSATTAALAGDGATTPMAAVAAPATMVCRLAVPALNVRSGPGLSFEIVAKVRSSGVDVATVAVTARTEDNQWLRVDERVATGGWVIYGAEYLTCDGDVLALPVVPAAELPATPTPLPVAIAPVEVAPVEAPALDAAEPVTETETAPAPAGIPAGYARLQVSNGFDQPIRFTLDQTKRVELGSSEFDLQPGDSVSILVFPGMIEFSASAAWRDLSGNSNFWVDADSERALWLSFIPDPGEPGNWVLVY